MIEIPDKEMFRPDEVARLLDVSKRTVERRLVDGSIQGSKIAPVGSKRHIWRIPRNALLAYLEEVNGVYDELDEEMDE